MNIATPMSTPTSFKPLSFKAACLGFVASTTTMTLVMMLLARFV